MRKKLLLCILLPFIKSSLLGQVGISTKNVNPDIILQVESKPQEGSSYRGGLLFPRVALSSTNVFLPVTGASVTGLMVYNTATAGSGTTSVTPGFYYWDATSISWIRMGQKIPHTTALFANQNTTTNLNSGTNIFADLFANVRFNNNTALYQKIDNTTLRINETGYYKVILDLDLASSGGADNFGVEIVVNNSNDIVSDNMYIPGRWDSEGGAETYFPIGKSFVIYIPINVAGYTLRVRTYQLDPGTTVQFKNPNTSTISIEKIR